MGEQEAEETRFFTPEFPPRRQEGDFSETARCFCFLSLPPYIFGRREETAPAIEIIYCLGAQGASFIYNILRQS